MAFAPGTRLGAHEIVGLLGAGGMGDVYLAHDTKLNRRVAIKVLPDAYANDPERIARFHREAQAVAALNHSGIAAIYDLAEADGTKYLVLELIEGETLADRLKRGPVPVEEALQIAKQILEALEAAHERGICHRDLKPANIKLTPDGGVKVLDFGLAKFLQSSAAAPQMTHSPTISLAGTYPGVILGTAGYMSPEQARGYEADQRSDIFSFGCILYELLTGRQAFEGESASDILASVLKSEVDWNALPPRLNPRLVEVLRRCLEKNPKKRWHAAADVRVEIEAIIGRGLVAEEPHKAVAVGRPLWKRALAAVLFTIAGALVAGYAVWMLRPAAPSAITRFKISLPEGQSPTASGRHGVVLSPDGTQLVYVAANRLFLRPLSAFESRAIPGSESPNGVVEPAFSPDGRSIAFRSNADNTLKRLSLSGGAAVTICPIDQPYGISWHEDAIIWAQQDKGILRVSPDGGVPEVIATKNANEVIDGPQLLPGGRAVMFAVRKPIDSWDQGQIVAQPLAGGARTTLISAGSDARYIPTGHIAYALGGVVFVVPFDVETLTVTGGPVPLVEGVRRAAAGSAGTTAPGSSFFAISNSGTLAYVPGPVGSATRTQSDLALFDRKGNVEPLKLPPGSYRSPRVSRDGRWVAFDHAETNGTFISVYEIGGRGVPRRLTFDGRSVAPLWSMDGQWIVYSSEQDGAVALFRIRADGTGTPERLTTPDKGITHYAQSWLRDGSQLLFSAEASADGTSSRLWLLSIKERKINAFGPMVAREATISPDGRWIAYAIPPGPGTSAGATTNQVFVEPFPRTESKYQLPQPGYHPMWSPAGDELITQNMGLNHWTPVITSPTFAFGRSANVPRRGRVESNPATGRRQGDMMPDGRILGIMSAVGSVETANEILIVLNWFDEVRQRVPKR